MKINASLTADIECDCSYQMYGQYMMAVNGRRDLFQWNCPACQKPHYIKVGSV